MFGGVTANSDAEAAGLFAKFFQSVYSADAPTAQTGCFEKVPTCDINIPELSFSVENVRKALEDVDEPKGAGVDGLPPLFLKKCASSLALPIASL